MSDDTIPSFKKKIATPSFFACFFSSFFVCLAYFPLNPTLPLYLRNDLGMSGAEIGRIVSAYAFAALFSRPITGMLLDSFSRKKLYILFLAIFTSSFIVHHWAFTFIPLFLLRCFQGVLWGGITAGGSAIITDVVPASRRGEGLSYYGLSMPIAMGFGPIIGMAIFSLYSFTAVWVEAIVLSFIAVICAFFITTKRTPNHVPKTNKTSIKDKLFFKPGVPIVLTMLFLAFPQGIAISYAAMYGQQIGMETPAWFYVSIAFGGICSRLFIGKNLDKGYLRYLVTMALSLLVISYVMLSLIPQAWCYICTGIGIGIGFGMMMPSMLTMLMNLAKPEQRGAASSTLFTAMDLGFGLGILIGGALIDITGLNKIFLIGAAVDLVAIVVFLTISYRAYQRLILQKLSAIKEE